jgi:hypothetical protein
MAEYAAHPGIRPHFSLADPPGPPLPPGGCWIFPPGAPPPTVGRSVAEWLARLPGVLAPICQPADGALELTIADAEGVPTRTDDAAEAVRLTVLAAVRAAHPSAGLRSHGAGHAIAEGGRSLVRIRPAADFAGAADLAGASLPEPLRVFHHWGMGYVLAARGRALRCAPAAALVAAGARELRLAGEAEGAHPWAAAALSAGWRPRAATRRGVGPGATIEDASRASRENVGPPAAGAACGAREGPGGAAGAEPAECPICLGDADAGAASRWWSRLPCGHRLHLLCSERWTAQKHREGRRGGAPCPVCRMVSRMHPACT